MKYTSYIELSQSALQNNIDYMRNRAGKQARFSMVIKGNAYGHGIEDLVPMAEQCGVDHFSVFSVEEARRALKTKKDICDLMIMGYIDNHELDWAIENEVSFFLFTPERLEATVNAARKATKKARVHIELETGMHRTGFCPPDIDQVVDTLLANQDTIELEGLCTHFAGAESLENFMRIVNQMKRYNRISRYFDERGLHPRYHHMACSAGVLNFPDSARDLVRVGISNYGFWPNNETRMMHFTNGDMPVDPLKRVLSWKSEVMSVNNVAEGEYVSYGKSYLTNRDSKIATVPVGYSYGFSRNLSNMGHVLIGGKRVPVVGAVNMNMMVVDVTDLESIAVGDEVVLIGEQGNNNISVSSFSDMNNSMNYELLTRLPNDIPRKVVD